MNVEQKRGVYVSFVLYVLYEINKYFCYFVCV